MKNYESFEVKEMSLSESKLIQGGGPLSWVTEAIVDYLINNYPTWKENGGADQTTYGSIGMGLSGNTAFTGM